MHFHSRVLLISLLAFQLLVDRATAQEVTSNHRYDALGRLEASEDSNGDARSYCYDEAGNRIEAKGSTSGATTTCAAPAAPPPPPDQGDGGSGGGGGGASNNPPVANDDIQSVPCNTVTVINLTANDSDPEGDYPLVLQSVTRTSGLATATVSSDSSVTVTSPNMSFVSSTFDYVVADSQGATATGQLTVTTQSCGGSQF